MHSASCRPAGAGGGLSRWRKVPAPSSNGCGSGRPREVRSDSALLGRQDAAAFLTGHRLGNRHCRYLRLGVGMGGTGEDLVTETPLDHPPHVHHRHPFAHVSHHGQVVSDERVGQPQLVLQFDQQVDYLRLDGHVQRRDRLVQDQQFGTKRQRPGDAYPLPLTSRELVGILLDVAGSSPTNPRSSAIRSRSGRRPS